MSLFEEWHCVYDSIVLRFFVRENYHVRSMLNDDADRQKHALYLMFTLMFRR